MYLNLVILLILLYIIIIPIGNTVILLFANDIWVNVDGKLPQLTKPFSSTDNFSKQQHSNNDGKLIIWLEFKFKIFNLVNTKLFNVEIQLIDKSKVLI